MYTKSSESSIPLRVKATLAGEIDETPGMDESVRQVLDRTCVQHVEALLRVKATLVGEIDETRDMDKGVRQVRSNTLRYLFVRKRRWSGRLTRLWIWTKVYAVVAVQHVEVPLRVKATLVGEIDETRDMDQGVRQVRSNMLRYLFV